MSHSASVLVLDLADLEIEPLVVGNGAGAPYRLESINDGHGLTEAAASCNSCCGCCCSCAG